ncbi:MAG: ribonuclease III domain-containing protein, partial [Candidatus Thermoplasmatota archaeon]
MSKHNIEELEKKIGYTFDEKKLLKNALTHKTYAFEAKKPVEYNERLEFLGDAVLDFVIAEQLYNANRYFSEGELTRRKATLVNNIYLSEKASELKLGKYLRLGVGEKKQKGENNPSNLANALEAVIGAIFIDSDMSQARDFILNFIFD